MHITLEKIREKLGSFTVGQWVLFWIATYIGVGFVAFVIVGIAAMGDHETKTITSIKPATVSTPPSSAFVEAERKAEEELKQKAARAYRDPLAALQDAEEDRQQAALLTRESSDPPNEAKAKREWKEWPAEEKTNYLLEAWIAFNGAEDYTFSGKKMYGVYMAKIVWPGFAQYSRSDQKDLLHGLMKFVQMHNESGGHKVTIHNNYRKISEVEYDLWDGVTTEFF